MRQDAAGTDHRGIARATVLLRAVAEGPPEGLRLARLAEATGLHRATAHRLLTALVAEGLLQRDAGHRFLLGPELWRLGLSATQRFDLVARARPSLQRLAEVTGDTVYLSVRAGDEALCLDRCEGAFPIRTLTLSVGDHRPLGVGAGSLALLAALPPEEVAAVAARLAPRLAAYPAFSAARLVELASASRAQGFAHNDAQIVPGMAALGVALGDRHGRVLLALSVAAICDRMQAERRAETVAHLRAEAARLGQTLGL